MKLEPTEPNLITLAEAAAIAGRSYSWARDRAVSGALETRRTDAGRIFVEAESLRALMTRRAVRTSRRPAIRLVWTNPNT